MSGPFGGCGLWVASYLAVELGGLVDGVSQRWMLDSRKVGSWAGFWNFAFCILIFGSLMVRRDGDCREGDVSVCVRRVLPSEGTQSRRTSLSYTDALLPLDILLTLSSTAH